MTRFLHADLTGKFTAARRYIAGDREHLFW